MTKILCAVNTNFPSYSFPSYFSCQFIVSMLVLIKIFISIHCQCEFLSSFTISGRCHAMHAIFSLLLVFGSIGVIRFTLCFCSAFHVLNSFIFYIVYCRIEYGYSTQCVSVYFILLPLRLFVLFVCFLALFSLQYKYFTVLCFVIDIFSVFFFSHRF